MPKQFGNFSVFFCFFLFGWGFFVFFFLVLLSKPPCPVNAPWIARLALIKVNSNTLTNALRHGSEIFTVTIDSRINSSDGAVEV